MSPPRYRLVIEGELGARYASPFDGMTLRAHDGKTETTGPIIDPSHLQGLLERTAGLGRTLHSNPLETENAEAAHTTIRGQRRRRPALVSGDWTAYWVYVAGPLLGVAIAVGWAVIFRGRGGDAIAHAAGAGVLTPGRAEEKAKLAQEIDAGKVVAPGLDPTTGASSPGDPERR
jgi:hypothetical protein